MTNEPGHAPQAASVLLPTTALALRVLAPPKFVLAAKLLRANGRSGGFARQFSTLPPATRSAQREHGFGGKSTGRRAQRASGRMGAASLL
ncbi:MAG TPA: hypothetical protein VKP30_00335 [Polyangiaceae bacterium]|nr:hypothetical protein [Polyangiaceae bacterium]